MTSPAWDPITTADYHTGGEPFRIITGGVPPLEGNTVAERREWARDHLDHVRQLLINEPRGHADMYGCFVTPPDDDGADLGVVFFHNEGYSTACGHGTIALATWAVESNYLDRPPRPSTAADGVDATSVVDLVIDAPSGRLSGRVGLAEDGRVAGVAFDNVPSFVAEQVDVAVPAGGTAVATVAFGGAFYAILDATDCGFTVSRADLPGIVAYSRQLKRRLNERIWVHPHDERLRDIYGVILVEDVAAGHLRGGVVLGDTALEPIVQRNVTVFADGEVDRSPTGSGTSARLAALYAGGVIQPGQVLVNVSIVDSVMHGVVGKSTTVGPYDAVHTTVAGRAFATGTHTFTLDPRDAIGTGFLLH